MIIVHAILMIIPLAHSSLYAKCFLLVMKKTWGKVITTCLRGSSVKNFYMYDWVIKDPKVRPILLILRALFLGILMLPCNMYLNSWSFVCAF